MKKSGHGGNLNYYSEKYEIPQNLLLDFSANINPLGPSKKVFDAISVNIENIKDYPEPNSETLLNIAEKKLNIDKNSFIFGNGAAELLFLLVNHLSPKKVFIPAPTFSEYERASKAVGSEVIYYSLFDDYKFIDLSFVKNISEGDIVFICNPNNPTGTFFQQEIIEELLIEVNNKKAYLFLDESFIDFIEDEKYFTFQNKVSEVTNLFILYSMTKIYGIPGLRLGMLFGKPSVISALYDKKDPWNVNIFAQKTGEILFNDFDFIKKSKKFFSLERNRFAKELATISNLKVYEPSANFIFIKITDGTDVELLEEFLIQEKILIRNCSNYPGLNNNFFRIAIKKPEENNLLYLNLVKYFCKK